VHLFVGDRQVFDATQHDDEYALIHDGFAIAEFHAPSALKNHEQLVFIVVMMPDELAFSFTAFT
jgi:hypothetical protein